MSSTVFLTVPKMVVKCLKCSNTDTYSGKYWGLIINNKGPEKVICSKCGEILELRPVFVNTFLQGEINPPRKAKHSPEKIEEIRQFILDNPNWKNSDIAAKFEVTRTFVYRLRTGGR